MQPKKYAVVYFKIYLFNAEKTILKFESWLFCKIFGWKVFNLSEIRQKRNIHLFMIRSRTCFSNTSRWLNVDYLDLEISCCSNVRMLENKNSSGGSDRNRKSLKKPWMFQNNFVPLFRNNYDLKSKHKPKQKMKVKITSWGRPEIFQFKYNKNRQGWK